MTERTREQHIETLRKLRDRARYGAEYSADDLILTAEQTDSLCTLLLEYAEEKEKAAHRAKKLPVAWSNHRFAGFIAKPGSYLLRVYCQGLTWGWFVWRTVNPGTPPKDRKYTVVAEGEAPTLLEAEKAAERAYEEAQ